MLAKKNAHPRDKAIEFDEKPHIYTVKGDSDYTSVTKWVHSHFDTFNADKVIQGMMSKENWNTKGHKYYGMKPHEIKKQWSLNGKEASKAGTKLHNDIEDFYNGKSVTNNSKEYDFFKNFYETHSELKAYRTEWMIYHEELKLAGSIDMVYSNPDGILMIYDWKRCGNISKHSPWNKYALTPAIEDIPDTNYWHYAMQLNTYKYILEDKYDKIVTDLYLVCLHPDKTDYECIKIPDLQDVIRNLMKLRT